MIDTAAPASRSAPASCQTRRSHWTGSSSTMISTLRPASSPPLATGRGASAGDCGKARPDKGGFQPERIDIDHAQGAYAQCRVTPIGVDHTIEPSRLGGGEVDQQ